MCVRRRVIRVACLPLSALLMCGCVSEVEPREDPTAEVAASGDAIGYDSMDELMAFLQSMSTADDRVQMMDLMWSRSLSDTGTARAVAQLIEAQRAYLVTLADAFDGAQSDLLDAELGIDEYAEALQNAQVSEISQSRRAIDFTDDLGQERRLVAVKVLGKWRLHATSIKNGEEMVQVWFHPLQGRLRGITRRYGDVTQKIKDGEITSVEDAEAQVREILRGGPVLYGGLEYLTIDAQLEPDREPPQTNVRSG